MLSFAYLLVLRAGAVTPSFAPLLVLAAFPVASVVLGARRGLLAIALVELGWTVVAEVMVGFAVAVQSG